eukprot:CAMPEP_0206134740 /NCGR_PEP_ID=MMETSP1473-20131121/182_1 /ASSEMBLY_ACC=CAM_ASM_001109 /TAXON_ID=1461547 /ORGANISM="Stichococcus sp, Strain RCC1054" /LENGTH=135 /DNA_ID=CAMNT_0053526361 /DNA_START=506 /DNA_END=910 /DNA_ORIENTATION=+
MMDQSLQSLFIELSGCECTPLDQRQCASHQLPGSSASRHLCFNSNTELIAESDGATIVDSRSWPQNYTGTDWLRACALSLSCYPMSLLACPAIACTSFCISASSSVFSSRLIRIQVAVPHSVQQLQTATAEAPGN